MITEKNPIELNELLQKDGENIFILDVREQWEYDICHIDGSVHIPMGKILDCLNKLEKDKTLVIVCHHGIRSRIVGRHLTGCGFIKIINLSGGIDKWAKEIDNGMKRYV
tara:strand:+ start:178 stop:504 length:327 start_codon:yes stop_codon:yes gene_type:complete